MHRFSTVVLPRTRQADRDLARANATSGRFVRSVRRLSNPLALVLLGASLATAAGTTIAFAEPLFASPSGYYTASQPQSVAIGDLNADGRLDVVTGNYGSNTVSVLLGNGDGTLRSHVQFGTGSAPTSVAIADLNSDARPDLAVANSSGVSVLLGHGDGTFEPMTNFGTDANSVAVGDFNADGRPDLVAASFSHTVSVLLGNGDGTFAPKTDYPAGHYPHSVAVA